MKTLIITLEYPPQIGGIASYVHNLAQHLPPDDVVVYAPKSSLNYTEFDSTVSYKVLRHYPYYRFFWPRWLKMFWQIRDIVKIDKIEQIYVQHVLPVGYIAYLIKLIFKIPYTIFLHGTDLEMGALKGYQLGFVCRHADRIILNSGFLRKKFVSMFSDIPNSKLKIIYPCPDDNFLKKVNREKIYEILSLYALEGKKIILSVGRMDEGKGYPHLLRVLPRVVERVPNAVCVIAGDGPKHGLLVDMARKSGLQNAVRFVGNIDHHKLPAFYQIADVFVQLCHKDLHSEEGWGTVFVEAAASGLPVVAGRAGGVEESVCNNVNGKIVSAYNEDEVVSALVELLLNGDLNKQMGESGIKRARELFNWNTQILKFYE